MKLKLPELTRKEWIILGSGAGVILIGIAAATVYSFLQHRDTVTTCTGSNCTTITTEEGETIVVNASPTPSPTPTLLPSKLNGALVAEGSEALRPLAVMIENHVDARPQSGLSRASVVYEATAEGGITRFMALFNDPRTSVRVGPVRSARPYFVDFATEYKAFYAHVGGNATALDQIKATGVYDLDQFGLGEPTYKRDFSRNVATEHTMYSGTDKLWNAATTIKKWGTNAEYESWKFTDDGDAKLRPATQSITVNFSTPSFLVDWQYNPTTNVYVRSMGGKPHIDAIDGQGISAKVVVLQSVTRSAHTTRINEHGWLMKLTGTGSAQIFQNGTVTQATWKKTGSERTRYYNSANEEIAFVRGLIWVAMVHSDVPVTVK
ncbi:DUF3048 domain-containing protein [soil metagenome]